MEKPQIPAPETQRFFARVLVKPNGSLKGWEVTGTGGSFLLIIIFFFF
jgi:hypothetical protein